LARVIAVPLLALRALAAPVRVLSTLIVSASRFGKEAVELLSRETIGLLSLQDAEGEAEPTVAFRCIPLGTQPTDHLEAEIRELIGADLPLSLRVIRAPMFHGHAASLAIQFDAPVDVAAARSMLREAPSLLVSDEGAAPISTLDALAIDAMHVTEITSPAEDPTWLHLWVLGDNVRQGAALAAVSLVEGVLLRH
jgi:aspartate-semialdehyde dehydrogenase